MNMSTVNDRSTAERWEIDSGRSSLSFNLRHIVVQQIRGRFERWGGTLFIDSQQPWLSSVNVWVDLASITTEAPERDAHVRSSEFLDVARFPRAEFKSTNVDIPDGQIVVEGILNLHGIAHDLEIRAEVGATSTDADGRQRMTYTARAIVDRQSFGLHWNQDLDVGGLVVGDEVEIVARVDAVRHDRDTRTVRADPPAWPG
jgi:polyisoprenoid-binding protein YceI